MSWAYLGLLLFSTAGMAIIDARFKLFWFAQPVRALIVHATGFVCLLAWDFVGIGTGVFNRGDSPYMTGLNVAPHLPVEELFFLFFLCWLTMNLYGLGELVARKLAQRSGRES